MRVDELYSGWPCVSDCKGGAGRRDLVAKKSTWSIFMSS